MPARATLATLEFAAPVGRRVRAVTWLAAGLILAFVLVDLALVLTVANRLPRASQWAMILAPLIGFVVLVPVYFHAQVHGYRLTEDELQVLRRGRQNRFSLAGLESVEFDRHAMDWSFKVFGNDGLGAITGKFRNRKLGGYEALVTDRERTVVLRWADRCLVVSPDRADEFVAAVRARAGLRR